MPVGSASKRRPRQTPRIVHEETRKYPVLLIVLGVVLGIVLLGLFSIDYLQKRAIEHEQATEETVRQYEVRLAGVRNRVTELLTEVARMERAQAIEASTQEELRHQLAESRKEVAKLKKRLKFFESVVNAKTDKSGVRVHEAEIDWQPAQGAAESAELRVALVLAQSSKHLKMVSGRLDLKVLFAHGEPLRGSDKDTVSGRVCRASAGEGLSEKGKNSAVASFDFKYFQEISIRCTLPKDRTPSGLAIVVKPKGSKGFEVQLPIAEPEATQAE